MATNPQPQTQPEQSRALSPFQRKFGTLKGMLETKNVMLQIEKALPHAISADRFLRIALTELRTNAMLLNCTPESVVGSIIRAAQLGLELDRVLGQGYLIPYKNNDQDTWECQFQPGYRGYIQLSRNSGEIRSLAAHVVHFGEYFEYEHGTTPFLKHRPDDQFEDAQITHAYSVVHYTNGGFDFEVMSHAAVEKIRARSKAPNSPAWLKDWSEMAKAKVIRRLAKRLPVSAQNSGLVKAAALDEATDAGIPQNNGQLLEVDEQGNVNVATPPQAIGHNEAIATKANDKLGAIANQFSEGDRGGNTPRPPEAPVASRPTSRAPEPQTSRAAAPQGVPLNFR
jgi:recombination protein RecT